MTQFNIQYNTGRSGRVVVSLDDRLPTTRYGEPSVAFDNAAPLAADSCCNSAKSIKYINY